MLPIGGDDGDSGEATPTTRPPPTPELAGTIEVGNAPVGLAQVPGDGAIWVSNQFDGTVSRIDPGTYEVTETVSVGSRPGALLPSVGGVLNVVHPDAVIREVRLFDDNAVDTVLDLGLDLEFGTPHAEGEGGFWITDAQAGELLRVGLSSGEVVARIPLGSAPGAVAAGEGAVWVSDADQAVVSRFDPVSNEVTATIPVGAVGGITTGHGSVWVIGFEEGTVTRIDAETNEVVAEIPSVARASFGFFVSEDAVWYSSSIDNTVSRIDPLSNNVTTIDVGDQPYGLIVADGALWVTNRQRVRVERYEPAS
jgi:YVTN family beta-propeller protein